MPIYVTKCEECEKEVELYCNYDELDNMLAAGCPFCGGDLVYKLKAFNNLFRPTKTGSLDLGED